MPKYREGNVCEDGYVIYKDDEAMQVIDVISELSKGVVMEPQSIRIVPPSLDRSGPNPTQGTKVMVGDQELRGVYKIVLTAEINDVWRAEIHCHPSMQEMSALAVVHYPKRWWQRVLTWITGRE